MSIKALKAKYAFDFSKVAQCKKDSYDEELWIEYNYYLSQNTNYVEESSCENLKIANYIFNRLKEINLPDRMVLDENTILNRRRRTAYKLIPKDLATYKSIIMYEELLDIPEFLALFNIILREQYRFKKFISGENAYQEFPQINIEHSVFRLIDFIISDIESLNKKEKLALKESKTISDILNNPTSLKSESFKAFCNGLYQNIITIKKRILIRLLD